MVNITNTKSCLYICPPYISPPPMYKSAYTNEYKPRAYIRRFTVFRKRTSWTVCIIYTEISFAVDLYVYQRVAATCRC